jgi:hypothetical protein
MKVLIPLLLFTFFLGYSSCQRTTVEDYSPLPEFIAKPTGLTKQWNAPPLVDAINEMELMGIKTNDNAVILVHDIKEPHDFNRLYTLVSIYDKESGRLRKSLQLPYGSISGRVRSLTVFKNGCFIQRYDSLFCINTLSGTLTKAVSGAQMGVTHYKVPMEGKEGLYLFGKVSNESRLIQCIPETGTLNVKQSVTASYKHLFGIWTNKDGEDVLVGAANVSSTKGQITLWNFSKNTITPLYTLSNTPGGWSGDYQIAGDFVYLNTQKRIKGFHLTDSTRSWMYTNANLNTAQENDWDSRYILYNDGMLWVPEIFSFVALRANTGNYIHHSSTAFDIMNSVVFLGSQRFCYFWNNLLICHDQKTGALLWARNMNFEDGSAAPPGYVDQLAADEHSIYFYNERGLFAYQY